MVQVFLSISYNYYLVSGGIQCFYKNYVLNYKNYNNQLLIFIAEK